MVGGWSSAGRRNVVRKGWRGAQEGQVVPAGTGLGWGGSGVVQKSLGLLHCPPQLPQSRTPPS